MTRPSLAGIEQDRQRAARTGKCVDDTILASHVPALTAAVRAVLDLHQHDGHGECSHCPDPSDAHWNAPWPCPTVRALAAHLDLTDPVGEPT